MCEIDWGKAPVGATHWDSKVNLWCNSEGFYDSLKHFWEDCNHIDWGTDRYIPRPQATLKDWDDRQPETDDVNHPKHYQLGGGLEAIDVIRASLTDEEYRGYLKGNVLKYRLRAGAKGDAEKCIAKADWYKKELDK